MAFETASPKKRCCSSICAKRLWRKETGNGKTLKFPNSNVGRNKNSIPWNKGKECPSLSGENNGFYGKAHSKETLSTIVKKSFATKRKNKSFNTSKAEQEIYRLLVKKFKEVETQYSTEEYPFACDFYIPSLNLYIEYDGHWSHGIYKRKPYGIFDKDNLKHLALLKIWKNKDSKYYERAIKTWTKDDVKKNKIVKQNNLNFLRFYSLASFKQWFIKL